MKKSTIDSTHFSDTPWQFWIDRGGTFTDIVARAPNGQVHTRKLLSDNPELYEDAVLFGIRQLLDIPSNAPLPSEKIHVVKMGTTVATNALLEKKGEPTALVITKGLRDIIEIGYQARPKTFALNIVKPALLYRAVIEIDERLRDDGSIDRALDIERARSDLLAQFDLGIRAVAIVLMHAYKYPQHEIVLAAIAKDIGFTQISVSHEVSPLAKIVSRGETTVVDAYLTPTLRRYVDRVATQLNVEDEIGKLLFMQSSGGLTDAASFRGRDAILSGPAGGVVGAVHTGRLAGFDNIIGFDMGGTSTDVTHYAGEFERVYETEIAGVRMRVPMLHIHTVAAGGGSLLRYDGERFRVGPESAGANPGPVCYRRGGQLAVTDINVCLGKIQTDYFPKIFGPQHNQPLDRDATLKEFEKIAREFNDGRTPEDVAEGFLEIAVEHMAQAIKKISVARGYDASAYVLNCFGGAGGQHACLVAEKLGIDKILLHPLAGVLSAYGMGFANLSAERQQVINRELSNANLKTVKTFIVSLREKNIDELTQQGIKSRDITHQCIALLRYRGTDTTLSLPIDTIHSMRAAFDTSHHLHFGFSAPEKTLLIDTLIVQSQGGGEELAEPRLDTPVHSEPHREKMTSVYARGHWHDVPIYKMASLSYGHKIVGPAIVVESNATVVIEDGWTGYINAYRHLLLQHTTRTQDAYRRTDADPVRLEIFNNLFMSIAEQMGIVLRNTAQSVNVKERLDFSCAIFDERGHLVANAPHVPVHLGSMDLSVQVLIKSEKAIKAGDVFVHNNPFNGGSHLPDITVISPIFDREKNRIHFFVACRAHHEDVGGIAPGSMSPAARNTDEEGILFDCERLVEDGVFLDEPIRDRFTRGPYPARNVQQNMADLKAQIAANIAGVRELEKLVDLHGIDTVQAYMRHIQDNAEEAIRRVITGIENGRFRYPLDSGSEIHVDIKVDKHTRSARIDFGGTSRQRDDNLNAPEVIARAAVLYVFRCLVDDEIPLNAGCLKPISIIIPEGSMLSPKPPAAVVAGNVETSQAITNALFAALGALGSSQGTMNNLTFGNAHYQYYETICSGSPAGPGFDGTPAVHTHMTNTRLTDPEIMEQRYPVVLEEFGIDRNSGGRGRWNAGDGVHREIRFMEDMECSILSGHRKIPPHGSKGGRPGRVGENIVRRANGDIENLGGNAHIDVRTGDKVFIQTPTGGGFGPVKDSAQQKQDS